MNYEQRSNTTGTNEGDRESLDTIKKLAERVRIIASETEQFICSVDRLIPQDGKTPSLKTLVEEGYNVFTLGKAKIERIKRDLNQL